MDNESAMLLLSEAEATYAITLEPDEFWAWFVGDREVPGLIYLSPVEDKNAKP